MKLPMIAAWTEFPDLVPPTRASGLVELTALLLARGVGVEARVFTAGDGGDPRDQGA